MEWKRGKVPDVIKNSRSGTFFKGHFMTLVKEDTSLLSL
jgi:hypothetical protein